MRKRDFEQVRQVGQLLADRLVSVLSHIHSSVKAGKGQEVMECLLLHRFAGAGVPPLGSRRYSYSSRKIVIAV